MTPVQILSIYKRLQAAGIQIWIDGGWCVDALLGKQSRVHSDLDIAVERKDAANLKTLFAKWGYSDVMKPDATEWNFVIEQIGGSMIDVHVFEFNEAHENIYGIKYPFESLTGVGNINGEAVRCISAEWMYKFKTSYEPADKDKHDVQLLAQKFGFEVPEKYKA